MIVNPMSSLRTHRQGINPGIMVPLPSCHHLSESVVRPDCDDIFRQFQIAFLIQLHGLTEIYEYLRLLYARVGKTISPVSGTEVKKHQVSDIIKEVMRYPEGTRFAVFAPVVLPEGRDMKEQLEILRKEGYARLSVNDTVYRISEVLASEELLSYPIELLVDRLTVSDDKTLKSRLADSAETAFFEGHGTCLIRIYTEEGVVVKEFSKKFEADGMIFEEPTDMMFSFNNPLGACPTCEGFGKVLGIDENLVVPDKSLSVYQGAVVCWKGEVMGEAERLYREEREI